jgi:hypothetical protein
MRCIYFFLLFLCLNSFAASTWQEQVKSTLPPALREFIPGKTTLLEIEKSIGKAQLVKGSKYYWERDRVKYALELTIKSKTLNSMHFTFTGTKPSLELLQGKINLKDFKPHQKGRFLKLEDKGSELIIDPIGKTIYSVRLP